MQNTCIHVHECYYLALCLYPYQMSRSFEVASSWDLHNIPPIPRSRSPPYSIVASLDFNIFCFRIQALTNRSWLHVVYILLMTRDYVSAQAYYGTPP